MSKSFRASRFTRENGCDGAVVAEKFPAGAGRPTLTAKEKFLVPLTSASAWVTDSGTVTESETGAGSPEPGQVSQFRTGVSSN